jgi:pSer/pThr/pTyr-binding forkhead associated (FHA) protein
MWKLTIEDDEGKQTALPLAHDEYGLGRGDENSIRLTDRNVSRKHARLAKNGEAWLIRDVQSYNGTYVNGVRVAGEQPVNAGDIIQLGDYRLELVDESKIVPVTDPSAQAALTQVPVHQRPNRLVVVVGPNPGTEYPLDREHFTIGRAEEATISINHSSVSRLHSELIALGNGRFEIIDKGSANGIRINGVELKRGILEAGDALELGDVRLRFVGAGKIFRAGMGLGVDGQGVRPMGFESLASTPVQKPGLGMGKLIGIGVVVAALVIGLVIFLRPPATNTPVGPTQIADMNPMEAAVIKEAKELVEAKDFERAHKKLEAINDNSPVRETQDFKDIETKWADWMFGKVEDFTDPAEKKRILQQILQTPSVSPEQRKKAVEMLGTLGGPEPTVAPQINNAPITGGGFVPSSSGGSGSSTATAKTAEPTATTGPTAPPPPGQLDESALRKGVEGKVWSGKASEAEIKLLIAICKHQRDMACRDRAVAMLKQKQGG